MPASLLPTQFEALEEPAADEPVMVVGSAAGDGLYTVRAFACILIASAGLGMLIALTTRLILSALSLIQGFSVQSRLRS
jgi:hypothetical protein